jgi:hypothetical protein
MVPVDGLTEIHAASPEAVQLREVMEFLLNVTVWDGGVGVPLDAEKESVTGLIAKAQTCEIVDPRESAASRRMKASLLPLPTGCTFV